MSEVTWPTSGTFADDVADLSGERCPATVAPEVTWPTSGTFADDVADLSEARCPATVAPEVSCSTFMSLR